MIRLNGMLTVRFAQCKYIDFLPIVLEYLNVVSSYKKVFTIIVTYILRNLVIGLIWFLLSTGFANAALPVAGAIGWEIVKDIGISVGIDYIYSLFDDNQQEEKINELIQNYDEYQKLVDREIRANPIAPPTDVLTTMRRLQEIVFVIQQDNVNLDQRIDSVETQVLDLKTYVNGILRKNKVMGLQIAELKSTETLHNSFLARVSSQISVLAANQELLEFKLHSPWASINPIGEKYIILDGDEECTIGRGSSTLRYADVTKIKDRYRCYLSEEYKDEFKFEPVEYGVHTKLSNGYEYFYVKNRARCDTGMVYGEENGRCKCFTTFFYPAHFWGLIRTNMICGEATDADSERLTNSLRSEFEPNKLVKIDIKKMLNDVKTIK